jgi:spermidine synthase
VSADDPALPGYCSAGLFHRGDGRPYVVDAEGMRSLHFESLTIQSQMNLAEPHMLAVDYTRTMMGFLLFNPAPRDILLIGLGGGSLVKYCLHTLPDTRVTAVEISPEVIALREAFGIPPDDERLRVVCGDGADYVRDGGHSPDVLLVDGFDLAGQPAQLCSASFYDHCHAMLVDGGVMAANLWSGDRRYGLYASRIRDSFDDRVVTVRADEDSNRIAFACKGRRFPPGRSQLFECARTLAPRHPIGIMSTAQRIQHRLERRQQFQPDLWPEHRDGARA